VITRTLFEVGSLKIVEITANDAAFMLGADADSAMLVSTLIDVDVDDMK